MHLLFPTLRAHTPIALEDLYGLRIGEIDGEVCLHLDKYKGMTYLSMFDIFTAWHQEAEKLANGEITKEEYNQWHYNYPKGIAGQASNDVERSE